MDIIGFGFQLIRVDRIQSSFDHIHVVCDNLPKAKDARPSCHPRPTLSLWSWWLN